MNDLAYQFAWGLFTGAIVVCALWAISYAERVKRRK